MPDDSDTSICEGESAVRVFGIFKFDPPLICDPNLLGERLPVVVGGIAGELALPASPEQLENLADPLREPLIPPSDAKTWKKGGKPISWGTRFAYSYPRGNPEVRQALLYFDIPAKNMNTATTQLQNSFKAWEGRFFDLLDLKSKQCLNTQRNLVIEKTSENLDLFVWSPDGKQLRPQTVEPTEVITFTATHGIEVPTLENFRDACSMASSESFLVPAPYQFQLAAYRAFQSDDYRKSVIETAVAAEIAVTDLTDRRLAADSIHYAEIIQKKFKMLSGRIDLARAMNFSFPEMIRERLIDARNRVAHRDHVPSILEARNAIDTTDEILETHFPLILPIDSDDAP
ncbi:hypothetical protein [Ottowia sp.]|uniref:hypothetical protein n=1 Tax=Ottowia sp. TaxID=1898956 RepID=UPI0025E24689|nr:hypothetical protein [Ottowia sp.]